MADQARHEAVRRSCRSSELCCQRSNAQHCLRGTAAAQQCWPPSAAGVRLALLCACAAQEQQRLWQPCCSAKSSFSSILAQQLR
jgi:hypothetical protein